MLFIKRYSISHVGITSSRIDISCFVLVTKPRYTVVKLGDASSEMSTAVLAGNAYVGASNDGGGFNGLDSKTSKGVGTLFSMRARFS